MKTTTRTNSIRKKGTVTLTTVQLRMLCDQAEALHFSNGPNARFWKLVDPNGIHVVSIWFVHQPRFYLWEGVDHPWDFTHGGGKNIRAEVMCKMLGTTTPCHLLCDFDYDAFMTHLKHARKVRRSRRRKLATAR